MKDVPIGPGSYVRTTVGLPRRGLVVGARGSLLLVWWEDELGKTDEPCTVAPEVVEHASLLEAVAAAAI